MKTSNILLVVIVVGGILGGLLMWETVGPSPLCGGCYRYNAPGCPVNPCPGQENLNVETSQINSPTNVILNIRNVGSVSTTFNSYIVKDSVGNQYTKSNWSGPTLNPNSLLPINIVIDGSAFTFNSKSTYTVTLPPFRTTFSLSPITP